MISTSGKKQTQKTNRVSTCFFISNVQPWLFAMCSTALSHLLDHCMSAQSVLKQLRDYRNCLKHLNKQFLGNYYFHLFKITKTLIVNLTKKKIRNYYAPLSNISPWLPCILKSYLGSRTTLTASLSSPTNLWDSLVYYHVSHFIQHKLRLCPIKLCAQPFWLLLMPHFDPKVNALFIRR